MVNRETVGGPACVSEIETAPSRLYKYRAFSERTLAMLVNDRLHYSDPRKFNDPMDTRPYVEVDLNETELASVLHSLVRQRVTARMLAARSPEDDAREASRRSADKALAEIEYYATHPDHDDVTAAKRHLFREKITEELLSRYDKGIVSLAERRDCPLMWSHYGNQHKGICLGYSVPDDVQGWVQRVRYDGTRLIEASKVAAMLEGNEAARCEVDEAVVLCKAKDWAYEREWRLLGRQGLHGSILELEEIVFGMKCEQAVKYVVMKALECRSPRPCFVEMREERGAFDLKSVRLSYDDEMFWQSPIRYRSEIEEFEVISDDSAKSASS